MVKFNKGKVRAATPASAITTIPSEGVRTHQGGAGWARDMKSELMLLSVAYLPAEDTHYELGCARDSRFVPLIHQVALDDPEWGVRFLEYLRLDTRMRTAAVIGAAEFARARAQAGAHGHTRDAVDVVCQRADEPGELLAYWFANVGRKLPMPVKRGLAQAVWRLYDEWSYLKWDSTENPIRFADVIGLVRPTGTLTDCDGTYPIKGTKRAALYEYLRAARTAGKLALIPQELPKLRRHAELMAVPVEQRRAHLNAGELRAAGMTRESLAGWLQGPMDAQAYEAIIPSMGYTALVRNLRNFDQAGISDESAQQVGRILADEDNVRKSRMAPLQFLAAYREAPSLRWAWPLEQAINHSLGNVPQLAGNTLILVDTSSSMDNLLSAQSKVKRWDAAATFGIALATRCARVEVVSFSSTARYWGDPHNAHTKQFTVRPGESLLVAVQRWGTEGCFLGGGTATGAALRRHYTGHDRVVVLTDEQAGVDPVDVDHSIPANVPMYTINLAGYAHGHGPSGANRHTWGGLNDEMFNVIRLVEAGKAADWDRIFRTRRKQEDAA